MLLKPTEYLRPMRGGAQSHLLKANDGGFYVVKFTNNPQHSRVLANEWLACRIAKSIGLTVPDVQIVAVGEDFVSDTPELVIRDSGRVKPVSSGLAFASPMPTATAEEPIYDYLPEAALENVSNLSEFAGTLVLDKWLCNVDGRQVIFYRPRPNARMKAVFIDWGFCFNAGDWTFPDSPMRGVYNRNLVYRGVTGWGSFEPWLSRVEHFSPELLRSIVESTPPEWYGDFSDILRLEAAILRRRYIVRHLIDAVRNSHRRPFENWNDALATGAFAQCGNVGATVDL